MRIYTEVIFEWNESQGKLVETSSESYEHSGEVALCAQWSSLESLGWDQWGNKFVWKNLPKQFGGKSSHRKGYVQMRKGTLTAGVPLEYESRKLIYKDADDLNSLQLSENRVRNYINRTWKEGNHNLQSGEPTIDEIKANMGGGYGELGTRSKIDQLKTVAVDSLKGITDDWNRILGHESEYRRAVDSSVQALEMAGKDGGTYEDPITGETVSVEGTLAMAVQAAQTSKDQAQEDLDVARGAARTGEERAVTARETAMRGARAGYAPSIRQAEAAAAATGFAGTGAGQQAREALREEFGEEAAELETAFEQSREDIATTEEAAETAKARADAATDVALGGAKANFASTYQAHQQTLDTQELAAKDALRGLQADMAGLIGTTRSDINDLTWDPFTDIQSELAADGGDIYGWDGSVFDPETKDIATYDVSKPIGG